MHVSSPALPANAAWMHGQDGCCIHFMSYHSSAIGQLKDKMGRLDIEVVDTIAVHGIHKGGRTEVCRSLCDKIAKSAKRKLIRT
jgi:hypothetical protein